MVGWFVGIPDTPGAIDVLDAAKSGSTSTSLMKVSIAVSFVSPLQAFHASHFHFSLMSVAGGDGVLQSPPVTCLLRPYIRHRCCSVNFSTAPACRKSIKRRY